MNYNSIPGEIRSFPQWVAWQYEDRRTGKPTKIPYSPLTGNFASVSRLDTWCPFETARLFEKCYSGLGFVLAKSDPFCFVDLDATEDEEEIEFQKTIYEHFGTYSEFSPSGKGLHLICKGEVPTGVRVGSVEMYSELRYMTMTGNIYRDAPFRECQNCIDSLFAHLNGKRVVPTIPFDQTIINTDLEIWEMASHASNGEKFLRLWNGDTGDYQGDDSRADFAIIDILGFYTNNHTQVKRLFRQSGLGKRPKAMREKYCDDMIVRAFDNKLPDLDLSKLTLHNQPLIPVKPIRTDLQEQLLQEMNAKPRSINEGVFSQPPGLVGDIAKFIYDQSYKPVPEIAITGAIALMAGLCGRAYNVEATGLNCYILLLAGTGRGKDSIASGISKLIGSVQHLMPTLGDFIGPGTIASGAALIKSMHESKTRSFVSVFGEFGITIKKISNSVNSNDIDLQKALLDFFSKSGAGEVFNTKAFADSSKNLTNMQNPAFSFVGESVPDRFYASIDENMILTGLLPRITVVEYLGLRPDTNDNHGFAIPSKKLTEAFCNLATSVYRLLQSQIPCNVQFTPEAKLKDKALDKLTDKKINDSKNSDIDELWNRAHIKTRRLAALLAVGINPYNPIIDDVCWNWAEAFVINSTEKLCIRFESGNIGNCSSEDNQLRTIRNYLRDYQTYSRADCNAMDLKFDLKDKGVILYSTLTKVLSKQRCFSQDYLGATAAIKKVLHILVDNGELIEINRAQMLRDYNANTKGFIIKTLH